MVDRDWKISIAEHFTGDDIDRLEDEHIERCGVRVQISTWADFFVLVQKLMLHRWYYRGESKVGRAQTTSLERVEKKHDAKESINGLCDILTAIGKETRIPSEELVREMVGRNEQKAIELFKELERRNFDVGENDYVGWLSVMQHYGVPTRLLDFTRSIFVALYFAFEKAKDNDRLIWAIDSDALRGGGPDLLKRLGCTSSDSIDQVVNDCVTGGYANVDHVVPVQFPNNNPRINAQNGLFLCPLSLRPFETNLSETIGVKVSGRELFPECMPSEIVSGRHVILQIVISNELRHSIEQVLSLANICHKTIYPDLEGSVRTVKEVF